MTTVSQCEVTIAFLLVATVLGIFLANIGEAFADVGTVIAENGTNIRSQPRGAKMLAIPRGTEFHILRTQGLRYYVRFASGHRGGGVHMKASLIFSASNVVANMGVILANGVVHLFKSFVPDFVIGLIVAVNVLRGGIATLKWTSRTSLYLPWHGVSFSDTCE